MCLPSDALFQHLPSYLGFSYLGRGLSLHGCPSKAQPLLLTLDERCLLTAALPDLQRGMVPLGSPALMQPPLLRRGIAPPGRRPWPQARGAPLGHHPSSMGSSRLLPRPRTWGSSSQPHLVRRSQPPALSAVGHNFPSKK